MEPEQLESALQVSRALGATSAHGDASIGSAADARDAVARRVSHSSDPWLPVCTGLAML